MLKAPGFWQEDGIWSRLLRPLSWVYTWLGRLRFKRTTPEVMPVPVICVGNLVMGGAGKTPTVIAIVEILKEAGFTPHIVSRGYGAIVRTVMRVDPTKHTYLEVGDEPLLLAKFAPTWASPDRIEGVKAACADGADVIVLDDGLQNPTIYKDFNILVVDGMQGFGNEAVFPAGPLREPINYGLERAHCVLTIGSQFDIDMSFIKNPPPLLEAYIAPKSVHPEKLRVVGFAGLGYPEKFLSTLSAYNFDVREFIPFADHHPYTVTDIFRLKKIAQSYKARLITTSKDLLRIPPQYRHDVEVLKINLHFTEPDKIKALLLEAIDTKIKSVKTKTKK